MKRSGLIPSQGDAVNGYFTNIVKIYLNSEPTQGSITNDLVSFYE